MAAFRLWVTADHQCLSNQFGFQIALLEIYGILDDFRIVNFAHSGHRLFCSVGAQYIFLRERVRTDDAESAPNSSFDKSFHLSDRAQLGAHLPASCLSYHVMVHFLHSLGES